MSKTDNPHRPADRKPDNVIDLVEHQRQQHGPVPEPPHIEFKPPACTSPFDDQDEWVKWVLCGDVLPRTSDPIVAQRIISSYAGPTGVKPLCADGYLWVYRAARGYWRILPDEIIKQRIYSMDGATTAGKGGSLTVNENRARSVLACIKTLLTRPLGENPFDHAPPGICFTNGFMAHTFELVEHKPEHYARWCIPCKYVPFDELAVAVDGSLLFKFLVGVFEDNSLGAQAAKLQALGEHMFAALSGQGPAFGRALLLWGPGGTGKSQALELYESLFAPDEVTSLPLRSFEDQQCRAELPQFALNACRELEDVQLHQLAPFKAIVHGEPVMAKAIYERPRRVIPRLAHVFACNDLPPVPTADTAFLDRWLVLRFTRRFRGQPDCVPGIARKIIEQERGLLMSWLIDCGKLLHKRGHYALPDEHNRSVEAWQDYSSSVGAWYSERCTKINDGTPVKDWPLAQEMFNRYCEFTRSRSDSPVSYREFKKKLSRRGVEFCKHSTVRAGLQLLPG